ncbi:MAG: PilZ domain-containing protein [bacterium]|nr:PilZ domain-containing protein [Gammaproteobacteria bacterium]HIL97722.1 PilZ domain-containing protein [Pseudomonadales bacterium]
MGEDFIVAHERRAFTRLAIKAPVEVRQGDSVWKLELIDLSLTGLAVTEPDEIEADYSHPFYFYLCLEPDNPLQFHANLIRMDPGCIGFDMGHLEKEQLVPLAKLLSARLDEATINKELALLASMER